MTDVVSKLNFLIEQWVAINRVHMHLQLLLVSNLLMCKKNTIKYALIHGLVDESYISKLNWPSSVPCKKIFITGRYLV